MENNGKKPTAWILQATTFGNCIWDDRDMAKKRKPHERNWISIAAQNKAIRTNFVKFFTIKSRYKYRFREFSLFLCHPSLPAGLPNYTLCPHRAVVGKFLLVSQNLPVKGSIGERHSWARPCFSSCVPHVKVVSMVKCQSLAQFSVDHLSNPVMSNLELLVFIVVVVFMHYNALTKLVVVIA